MPLKQYPGNHEKSPSWPISQSKNSRNVTEYRNAPIGVASLSSGLISSSPLFDQKTTIKNTYDTNNGGYRNDNDSFLDGTSSNSLGRNLSSGAIALNHSRRASLPNTASARYSKQASHSADKMFQNYHSSSLQSYVPIESFGYTSHLQKDSKHLSGQDNFYADYDSGIGDCAFNESPKGRVLREQKESDFQVSRNEGDHRRRSLPNSSSKMARGSKTSSWQNTPEYNGHKDFKVPVDRNWNASSSNQSGLFNSSHQNDNYASLSDSLYSKFNLTPTGDHVTRIEYNNDERDVGAYSDELRKLIRLSHDNSLHATPANSRVLSSVPSSSGAISHFQATAPPSFIHPNVMSTSNISTTVSSHKSAAFGDSQSKSFHSLPTKPSPFTSKCFPSDYSTDALDQSDDGLSDANFSRKKSMKKAYGIYENGDKSLSNAKSIKSWHSLQSASVNDPVLNKVSRSKSSSRVTFDHGSVANENNSFEVKESNLVLNDSKTDVNSESNLKVLESVKPKMTLTERFMKSRNMGPKPALKPMLATNAGPEKVIYGSDNNNSDRIFDKNFVRNEGISEGSHSDARFSKRGSHEASSRMDNEIQVPQILTHSTVLKTKSPRLQSLINKKEKDVTNSELRINEKDTTLPARKQPSSEPSQVHFTQAHFKFPCQSLTLEDLEKTSRSQELSDTEESKLASVNVKSVLKNNSCDLSDIITESTHSKCSIKDDIQDGYNKCDSQIGMDHNAKILHNVRLGGQVNLLSNEYGSQPDQDDCRLDESYRAQLRQQAKKYKNLAERTSSNDLNAQHLQPKSCISPSPSKTVDKTADDNSCDPKLVAPVADSNTNLITDYCKNINVRQTQDMIEDVNLTFKKIDLSQTHNTVDDKQTFKDGSVSDFTTSHDECGTLDISALPPPPPQELLESLQRDFERFGDQNPSVMKPNIGSFEFLNLNSSSRVSKMDPMNYKSVSIGANNSSQTITNSYDAHDSKNVSVESSESDVNKPSTVSSQHISIRDSDSLRYTDDPSVSLDHREKLPSEIKPKLSNYSSSYQVPQQPKMTLSDQVPVRTSRTDLIKLCESNTSVNGSTDEVTSEIKMVDNSVSLNDVRDTAFNWSAILPPFISNFEAEGLSLHDDNLQTESTSHIKQSALPANSPYWMSPAKAQIETSLRVMTPSSPKFLDDIGDDCDKLLQKKDELIRSINKKLSLLSDEKVLLQKEIDENEEYGQQIFSAFEEKCSSFVDKSKVKVYVDDLEKTVRLLLKLSGLLVRTENAISSLPADSTKQRRALVEKLTRLRTQYRDAESLKADSDRRRVQVIKIMSRNISREEVNDILLYIDSKFKLTIDMQELKERLVLGHEQLTALKQSVPSL